MDFLKAALLGVIQGASEFLPVSSSGHLVIFQKLFGLDQPEIFFDVMLHLGTLGAVALFFRKELIAIISSAARLFWGMIRRKAAVSDFYNDPNGRMALFIVIGSIPTAIIGLLINEVAERLFSSIFIVSGMLALTGGVLWLTRKVETLDPKTEETPKEIKPEKMDGLSVKNALVIGTVQGFAAMPGLSRSGSTIVAGLFLGLDRETAARYSFLLSIPAVAGAALLSAFPLPDQSAFPWLAVAVGAVVAGAVGYAALCLLIRLVKKGRLHVFAPYCWAMAAAAAAGGFFAG